MGMSDEDAQKICELLCTHDEINIELAKQLFYGFGRNPCNEWSFLVDNFFYFCGFAGGASRTFKTFNAFKGCHYKEERYTIHASVKRDIVFPKHNPKCFHKLEIIGTYWEDPKKTLFSGIENTTFSWLYFEKFTANKLPAFDKTPLPNIKAVSFDGSIKPTKELIDQLPEMPNLERMYLRNSDDLKELDERFKGVNIKHL